MRPMSGVGHPTAFRSALFVELGFRDLFAFVSDGKNLTSDSNDML